MEIDLARWAKLLAEHRDARFHLRGCNQQLQQAQTEAMAAQAARDKAAAERILEHRNAAIAAVAERNLAECEGRLVSTRAELARVQQRSTVAGAEFRRLSEIVRQCLAWASQHGLVLSDADLSASAAPPTAPAHADNSFGQAVEAAAMLEGASAPSAAALSATSADADIGVDAPGILARVSDVLRRAVPGGRSNGAEP